MTNSMQQEIYDFIVTGAGSGKTNAPSIMIGEKAAAMILEDTRAAA